MNVNELLKERELPALTDRKRMKKLLLDKEYGYVPSIEYTLGITDPRVIENRYLTGTVYHSTVDMTIGTKYGNTTFL